MSQIVSKQSLKVLANLAFTRIRIAYEGDGRAAPERNLDETAVSALFELLKPAAPTKFLDFENEQQRAWAGAFSTGMDFGLAVAAAIITKGLDSAAIAEAVEAELRNSVCCWPQKPQSEAA